MNDIKYNKKVNELHIKLKNNEKFNKSLAFSKLDIKSNDIKYIADYLHKSIEKYKKNMYLTTINNDNITYEKYQIILDTNLNSFSFYHCYKLKDADKMKNKFLGSIKEISNKDINQFTLTFIELAKNWLNIADNMKYHIEFKII